MTLYIVTGPYGTKAFHDKDAAFQQAREWGRCRVKAIKVR